MISEYKMSFFNFPIESASEPRKKKAGVKEKYPFSKLKVGQMFRFDPSMNINTMRCNAYQRGESLGYKFAVDGVDCTVTRVE